MTFDLSNSLDEHFKIDDWKGFKDIMTENKIDFNQIYQNQPLDKGYLTITFSNMDIPFLRWDLLDHSILRSKPNFAAGIYVELNIIQKLVKPVLFGIKTVINIIMAIPTFIISGLAIIVYSKSS